MLSAPFRLLHRTADVLSSPSNNRLTSAIVDMEKAYLHHLLIAVEDLERARDFYTRVLEMQELDRPAFDNQGIWYKIGDGHQQLHLILRSDATLRRDKTNDPNDIHFALRVKSSYRDTLAWLRGKGFRDDVSDCDLRKMLLRPNSLAGYPQIYILDPDRNIIEFNCNTLD
jgi:glyoxylase I family protein